MLESDEERDIWKYLGIGGDGGVVWLRAVCWSSAGSEPAVGFETPLEHAFGGGFVEAASWSAPELTDAPVG